MINPFTLPRQSSSGPEPWLKLLIATSIVLPLAILAVVAWHDYDQTRTRAAERVERTTRIAREHALKVFETNDIVIGRVLDAIAVENDEELGGREEALHAQLQAFARQLPQVLAISIWDAEGRAVASSRVFPAPRDVSIADRDYFRALQLASTDAVISDRLEGRLANVPVFTMSRRRTDATGRFGGAVTIALAPGYFSSFYEQLAGGMPGVTVALTQPDGSVITRFPETPADGVRSVSHNPLIPLIDNAEPTAVTIAVSPQDSNRRIVMAQRVGDYPLFVTTGQLESAMVADWLQKLWLPALVAFGAGFALVLAALMTLDRTRRERAAVAQWQSEAARRASAERMLRHLTQHLIRLSETEKARLAAELHDELGGALSAIALDLSWVLERLKQKAPELIERQAQAMKLVQDTAVLKRRIIDGLRPMLLQHLGLAAALRDYVGQWSRKSGIPVDLEVPQEVHDLAPDAALALFRVVQESLTNVAKYANARRVSVAVVQEPEVVRASVTDDGVGIPPERLAHPTSHGLTGMEQRVLAFGGSLVVESAPAKGTRIVAEIPQHATSDSTASPHGVTANA